MEPKYGNKACKKPLEERNAVNSELGLAYTTTSVRYYNRK